MTEEDDAKRVLDCLRAVAPCEKCYGRGTMVRWGFSPVSESQQTAYTMPCPDCGGTGIEGKATP